ncbi:tax1-binding protein 1-like isoform X2 [Dendronephthya gigantea]|uniref:tax1-binding protein 1-like isoform X2 n=1 Tax=Dendronephthya gigantea TaxID=151771 RepID=UPI00106A6EFE|nr:tax1-binding protein 1-like isoform X2 [Dendronephthya gigantea]
MGLYLSRLLDLFSSDQSIVRNDHSVVVRSKDEAQREFVLGIQSLDKAIEVVRKADISGTTPARRIKEVAKNMRRPINQAHKHLTSAKNFWEAEKARQCEEIERRISTINGVKNIVSERRIKVERMNHELQDLDKQISDTERSVNQARSSLNSAQNSLRDAEKKLSDKKSEQDIVFEARDAMSAVPVIGWVAMPTMIMPVSLTVTALEDNVKSARSGVSTAEDKVRDCENRLEAKRHERDNLREQLGREKEQKEIAEQKLRIQEQQLQYLNDELRSSVELSEKLMKTCHVMTEIWGKRVLKNETRFLYSLDPLLTPLKEIVGKFTPEEQRKIKESTFLLSREVDFSGISLKLRAVAEASNGGSVQAILDQ